MALDQLNGFLLRLQDDEALKQSVIAASTADDLAKIAAGMDYSFSGEVLLRFSGKKVNRVTVFKQVTPGEYNSFRQRFLAYASHTAVPGHAGDFQRHGAG